MSKPLLMEACQEIPLPPAPSPSRLLLQAQWRWFPQQDPGKHQAAKVALASITGSRAPDGLVERLGTGPDRCPDVWVGDVPVVGGGGQSLAGGERRMNNL